MSNEKLFNTPLLIENKMNFDSMLTELKNKSFLEELTDHVSEFGSHGDDI